MGTSVLANPWHGHSSKLDRRHYKKDSRFVLDLYTLTYDSHESLDSLGDLNARRNDREEIRRRLATGCDTDEYYGGDRPGKKPSLQARLQSGMNLQICFMNETMSDTESPGSDTEPSSAVASPVKIKSNPEPPKSLNLTNMCVRGGTSLPITNGAISEADFFARQARLQAEARVALAQAKDMAHMQMQIERQRRQASPITDMLRASLHKVGVLFPEERRRLSRQMLTDMNLAQLQVIVNDLHTQIEYLNESLVKFLMERDDLHMSQDSMLVDIEDLTRYLGAKENTLREDFTQNNNNNNNNNNVISSTISKPKINRIAALVKK
ncbi:schwannomin interacting protein 1 isoform X2 [Lycorma delicatula]|uniref:schwannomin interacting protein 1 isoform X2 n=1 Tax=Lycorma delicatula TaxID=130591 RepID=UPI003F50F52A